MTGRPSIGNWDHEISVFQQTVKAALAGSRGSSPSNKSDSTAALEPRPFHPSKKCTKSRRESHYYQ